MEVGCLTVSPFCLAKLLLHHFRGGNISDPSPSVPTPNVSLFFPSVSTLIFLYLSSVFNHLLSFTNSRAYASLLAILRCRYRFDAKWQQWCIVTFRTYHSDTAPDKVRIYGTSSLLTPATRLESPRWNSPDSCFILNSEILQPVLSCSTSASPLRENYGRFGWRHSQTRKIICYAS